MPFFQGKADFGELYPSIRVYCSVPIRIAEKDDILLSVRAPVGATNLAPCKVCIGRGLTAIRPSDSLNLRYLLHFFRYYEAQLQQKGTGTTFKAITQAVVKEIEVPVPPLEEQARIVARIEELFSQLESGVETLKQTKEQLAVYRQAVLKEAFCGSVTQEWRDKNYSDVVSIQDELHHLQSKYKTKPSYIREWEIELPNLPDCWEWISIGEITKGVEYGTSQKSQTTGKVPVIRMGNIQNGRIDWSDLVFSDDDDEIQKYLLSPNDVLFNRTNSPELVGKTGLYQGEKPAIFAGYLIRINQFDCIDAKYLTYYLGSFIAKQYGNRVKTDGVNQSNINGKKLCSYPFPLCSIEEQRIIVSEVESRLSVCDQIEQTVDAALQQAEALRQSILKKAFEGGL